MLKKKWWDNENPKNSILIKFVVLRWRLRLRRRCFFQYLYNCLDFLLLNTFLFTAKISLINDFKFSVISVVKNALWIKYESCFEPEYRKKIIAPGVVSFRIFCRKWARLSQVGNCRKKSQKAFGLRTLEEKTKSRLKLEGKFLPLTNQL